MTTWGGRGGRCSTVVSSGLLSTLVRTNSGLSTFGRPSVCCLKHALCVRSEIFQDSRERQSCFIARDAAIWTKGEIVGAHVQVTRTQTPCIHGLSRQALPLGAFRAHLLRALELRGSRDHSGSDEANSVSPRPSPAETEWRASSPSGATVMLMIHPLPRVAFGQGPGQGQGGAPMPSLYRHQDPRSAWPRRLGQCSRPPASQRPCTGHVRLQITGATDGAGVGHACLRGGPSPRQAQGQWHGAQRQPLARNQYISQGSPEKPSGRGCVCQRERDVKNRLSGCGG